MNYKLFVIMILTSATLTQAAYSPAEARAQREKYLLSSEPNRYSQTELRALLDTLDRNYPEGPVSKNMKNVYEAGYNERLSEDNQQQLLNQARQQYMEDEFERGAFRKPAGRYGHQMPTSNPWAE